MNLIDVWIGISEAQRVLKISHIADACSGNGKEHMAEVRKEIDKLKSEIKMLESIRVDK